MLVKIARFSLVDLRCYSSDLNQIWWRCREKSPIDAIIMAALRIADADIIFLPCGFFFYLSSFFPRLISAVTEWMSTIHTKTTHGVALVRI